MLLAQANTLLGKLFFNRQVLDKALDHFSQAADFYGRYEQSPFLSAVLKQMGDVYYQQGKYNLALVHYFNVIDHQIINRHSVMKLKFASISPLPIYNSTTTPLLSSI